MITQIEIPKTLFKSLYDLNINDNRLFLSLAIEKQGNESALLNELINLNSNIQHPLLTRIFKNNSKDIIQKSMNRIGPIAKLYTEYEDAKDYFNEIKLAKRNIIKTTTTINVYDKRYDLKNFNILYNMYKEKCGYYSMKADLFNYIFNSKISIIELRLIYYLLEKNVIKNPNGRTFKILSIDLMKLLKVDRLKAITETLETIKGLNIEKKLITNYTIFGKGKNQYIQIDMTRNPILPI